MPVLPDPEEISANTLHGQPDEDFWINAVLPIPMSFRSFNQNDVEEVPAGDLTGQPDEDFYWSQFFGPPFPVKPVNYQKLPLLPDPEELPASDFTGQPDEDFEWNRLFGSPRPVLFNLYQRLPILPDPEEIPANRLYGQPDEDFWNNQVPPVSLLFRPFNQNDLEEIPGNTLSGQPDEDFWNPSIASVTFRLYQVLPYLPDLEEILANAISGQPEDDFWNPSIMVNDITHVAVQLDSDDAIGTVVFGPPEEDFWISGVAPQVANLYIRLPIDDSQMFVVIPIVDLLAGVADLADLALSPDFIEKINRGVYRIYGKSIGVTVYGHIRSRPVIHGIFLG